MCAPTDSLLFAEDLMTFIAKKELKLDFKSKINVKRFRAELKTTFSRSIGAAVHRVMEAIEVERRALARKLLENRMSVGFYIKKIVVDYENNFNALKFLVRCAWIYGLSVLERDSSENALEEALFLVADDLHKIPDPKFASDEIWMKVQECAEEMVIYDDLYFNTVVKFESQRYLTPALEF